MARPHERKCRRADGDMSSTGVKATGKAVSRSAYHGERQKRATQDVKALLLSPLFAERAHSLAMIKRAITAVIKAFQHLNPG